MRGALALALAVAVAALPVPAAAERAATAFTLKDLSGKKFDLKPHLGKDVVLLNFFATWCAPCMSEMPVLQKLHERYGEQGLKVVMVSIDDPKSAAKVKPLVREQGLTCTVLLDTESKVISLYNAKKILPFTVIIGKDGNVASEHFGFQPGDEGRLDEKLKGLLGLASSEPAKSETPAIP